MEFQEAINLFINQQQLHNNFWNFQLVVILGVVGALAANHKLSTSSHLFFVLLATYLTFSFFTGFAMFESQSRLFVLGNAIQMLAPSGEIYEDIAEAHRPTHPYLVMASHSFLVIVSFAVFCLISRLHNRK
jgi:hypothetical protein